MKKLLMMILMSCVMTATAVFGQEDNTRGPVRGPSLEEFQSKYINSRVTQFYDETRVCTKADSPRPGSRFYSGPCYENFRKRIPLNNSPAWDCENDHGKGNCLLVTMPYPAPEVVFPYGREGLDMPKLTWYVPRCQEGFGLFFITVRDNREFDRSMLFCGKPKSEN